jgi:hypothetical protein
MSKHDHRGRKGDAMSGNSLQTFRTLKDFQRVLGFGPRTVARYRAGGLLPEPDVVWRGKFLRWRPETFDAWVASLSRPEV